MTVVSLIGALVASTKPAQAADASATTTVANISDILSSVYTRPTGYKGADGKVANQNGKIVTTAQIQGQDAGFIVALPEVATNGAKTLSLTIAGHVFQGDGWAKFGSIQIMDGKGNRHILRELCQSVWDDCTAALVISSSALQQGATLDMALPSNVTSISRLEIVFTGNVTIDAGFTIKDIKLTK